MARTELPASVEELQQLVLDQRAELDAKQTRIDEQASLISFLQEWKRLMESQRFGSRSERLVPEQGRLFNEAETLARENGEEPEAIETYPLSCGASLAERPRSTRTRGATTGRASVVLCWPVAACEPAR